MFSYREKCLVYKKMMDYNRWAMKIAAPWTILESVLLLIKNDKSFLLLLRGSKTFLDLSFNTQRSLAAIVLFLSSLTFYCVGRYLFYENNCHDFF